SNLLAGQSLNHQIKNLTLALAQFRHAHGDLLTLAHFPRPAPSLGYGRLNTESEAVLVNRLAHEVASTGFHRGYCDLHVRIACEHDQWHAAGARGEPLLDIEA